MNWKALGKAISVVAALLFTLVSGFAVMAFIYWLLSPLFAWPGTWPVIFIGGLAMWAVRSFYREFSDDKKKYYVEPVKRQEYPNE